MVRALTEKNSQPKGDNCGAEFACANIESQQPANVDRVMNYGLTCVQLGIMLTQLNDTEKEGDGERCLAVQRSTNAVYGLKKVEAIDKESSVPPESTKHTHASTTMIVQEMIHELKRLKPFEEQPGRVLLSFPNIPKSPLESLDVTALYKWLTHNKKRLFENAFMEDYASDMNDIHEIHSEYIQHR